MVTLPLATSSAAETATHPWVRELLASLPAAEADAAAAGPDARAALAALPLPSRRHEDWRFTDPALITAVASRLLPRQAAAEADPLAGGHRRVRLDASDEALAAVAWPPGIEPLPAAEALPAFERCLQSSGSAEAWPLRLNMACPAPLLALRVTGPVPAALELVSDAADGSGMLPLRLLLLLESGARLELLQEHRASGPSLTSVVLAADLASGAELRHGLVASGAATSVLLAAAAIRQQPGSHCSLTSVSRGWGLARLEPRVVQVDGAAETRLRGLQLVDERQIADTHSRVRFDGPDGRLEQLHKVVAEGRGRSVFNGAVCVPRQAQRTDASQLSRSLLLSDLARVDTKPELEIVADDVRCAHGATVSRLQEDELFYLRSRGIGGDEAARLLLRGYCQEILDDLPAGAGLPQVPSALAHPEAGR